MKQGKRVHMTKKKWAISIIVILCLALGLTSTYLYRTYTTPGILWRLGISSSDIKLVSKDNRYFHHYLYEKDNERVGLLTLQRRGESNLWSIYIKEEALYLPARQASGGKIIRIFVPGYQNHTLIVSPVIGGSVEGDQEVQILTKGELRLPHHLLQKENKAYFLFTPDDLTLEDELEVIVED